MSLWNVVDSYTSQLMLLFYGNLSQGLTVSESLRQAKLDYIDGANSRSAHPFFWAALVPLGDTSPVIALKSNKLQYTVILLVILLLSSAWIVYRKKIMQRFI